MCEIMFIAYSPSCPSDAIGPRDKVMIAGPLSPFGPVGPLSIQAPDSHAYSLPLTIYASPSVAPAGRSIVDCRIPIIVIILNYSFR